MPLAHTPFRPRPVVECLGIRPISAEDAARGLAKSVDPDDGSKQEMQYELPGSTMVNFRQIPGIIEALQTDWVNLPGKDRPADCFIEVTGRLETHMHPCFLGEKLVFGLRGVAGTLLLRFNKLLQCVPLGFTRLEPAGTHAAVVGVSPYVHFLVDFKAVGFVPKRDQWLVGRVAQQQTVQGLNILILNCFNMFVKRSTLPSQLRWDDEAQSWVYDNQGKAKSMRDRGPVWVKNNTVSDLLNKGPIPGLFGLIPWPPLVKGGPRSSRELYQAPVKKWEEASSLPSKEKKKAEPKPSAPAQDSGEAEAEQAPAASSSSKGGKGGGKAGGKSGGKAGSKAGGKAADKAPGKAASKAAQPDAAKNANGKKRQADAKGEEGAGASKRKKA